jgi:Txe/YoeB family toxin of Txe-Axe toxin-antitoxin module
MGDDAQYMLDCDLLNADSQALLSQTKNDWHKEKTMNRYEMIAEVIAERLSIRIDIEHSKVYAVIFDRRGDELFEATYPGLNDMEAIQDVYRQFRQAKLEMEQKKP